MTTFAAPTDTERRRAELDARTRTAWASYREELRDLQGRPYEEAERVAWDQLQATLRDVEAECSELARTSDPG